MQYVFHEGFISVINKLFSFHFHRPCLPKMVSINGPVYNKISFILFYSLVEAFFFSHVTRES